MSKLRTFFYALVLTLPLITEAAKLPVGFTEILLAHELDPTTMVLAVWAVLGIPPPQNSCYWRTGGQPRAPYAATSCCVGRG